MSVNNNEECVSALRAGDWEKAETLARKSIKKNPNSVAAYQVLTVVETQRQRYDTALSLINKAIGIGPQVAESFNQKSIVLNKMKRPTEAITCLEEAIRLNPACPYFYMNLAGNLKPIGKMVEALDALEKALELGDEPHILCRLAGGYLSLGEFAKSRDYFERALALAPNLMLTHHELGYYHFYHNEFMEAWPRFELRLNLFPDLNFYIKQFGLDMHWKKGEDLGDSSLMVHTEQGNGDTIQFMRYLPLIKQRFPDCKVSFMVYDALEKVVENVDLNIDKLVVFKPGDQATVPAFERFTSLMSLPHLLDQAYPVQPLPLKTRVKKQFPEPDAFNVIIAYSGNPEHENDRWRSCPLKYFGKLAAIPGVRLHTLVPATGLRLWGEEIVNLQEDCNFELNDLSLSVSNFQDSAEYIHAADLTISVDTSLLHLAGSNLAPTWGLLSKYSEWRWGNEPTKTVWYPTVKLFRQENVNNWDELFDRVEEELRKKVSETLGEVAWVA